MIELLYTLIATHITTVAVTLFLHRNQSHRSVQFHPVVAHFFRFWLWLTTGVVTKQWVAVHRKHHRFSDAEGDPHSPHEYGIKRVFFKGSGLYHEAIQKFVPNWPLFEAYGMGTPADWIEHNVYTPHSYLGISILFLFNIIVFGWIGALIWGIQLLWIPFWAAGFINGIGHWWGYRNGETKDHSRNIVPWGIVAGGEELHNNHHLEPGNARFSHRWFEFDIGWMYICLLRAVKLATVK